MKLTAIILTYNESEHITYCINSLRFADEIVVFDSLSTDDTVQKAQAAGARVIQNAFQNYAQQRNAALKAVENSTDWVLFIDADERVSPELAAEIRMAITQPEYVGWQMPRHNYIFGKLTRWSGWYPDYQTRLLRVGKARYDREVHEIVVLDGTLGTLQQPLTHYNYRDVAHFTDKQRRYAAHEASILFKQGIRPKFRNYILQPWRQFKWRFWTLQGYKDSLHGLRLCALMAWYELRKYLMLRALWRKNG